VNTIVPLDRSVAILSARVSTPSLGTATMVMVLRTEAVIQKT
jgi:hypothetical protein